MLGTDSLYSWQSLLQTAATLLLKGKGINKWGNLQVGQLCVITKWSKNYYKVGLAWYWDNLVKKWVKYYKVGELLQSRPVKN